MRALTVTAAVLLATITCSQPADPDDDIRPSACTFANPIGTGQDPFVVQHDGWYYLVESANNAIWVYKSKELTNLKQNGAEVWRAPATGWNRNHLWAPELHFVNGRWYIYYAAGQEGPPFIHQRAGVLEGSATDPQAFYTDRGMLYTGDDVNAGSNPVWAIDMTLLEQNGQLFAIWSGWENNAATDKTPQHLYIARMASPTRIASNRVRISSPAESWETGGELNLQEGPQILRRNQNVFIIYSTRESWLKEYRLGQLRLASASADPMQPSSWIKSGPVFQGTDGVFGVGHASFTRSPDGSEDWIVYHSKVSATPGWERVIRTQKFTWNADGSPSFGTPVSSGQRIPTPAGQCQE